MELVIEHWLLYNVDMDGGETQNINLAGEAKDPSVSERVLFSWKAPSFTQNERSGKWYLIAAFLTLAIIAFSAWQQDWFMIGIVVVVAAILFWYIHAVVPQDIAYKITPMGIYADNRFYPYSEIHSFWMVYDQKVKNLYLIFRKRYLPALTINVEKLDPLILKGYLLKKLPEQENRTENIIDKITRIAGL
jgi:hypothetical protein